MGRDHLHPYQNRKASGYRELQKVIIYAEGRNTEYNYCEQLKRQNCSLVPVVQRGHGIGNCVDFVEESNKKFNNLSKEQRDKYKQKWLMYDCDGHEDFAESIVKARKYGFKVVFSNMCIEYWFVLHFYTHDGRPISMKADSHSQAQIDMINDYIKRYNRKAVAKVKEYDGDSKKVEDDFFDLMLAVDPQTHNRRIIDAYDRAKTIHTKKKANGAEFCESVTTMYEFLKEIGVIKEKDDGSLTLAEYNQ